MAAPMQQKIRVLELYSGIGGMHYALQASGIAAETIAALDINDLANKVYRHNFPDTNLMQRSIEVRHGDGEEGVLNQSQNALQCAYTALYLTHGITQAEFIKLDADLLLMSPPCQPFTRQGLKGDSQDARTKSFFYVMDMLPRLPKPPTYILVENVKGFETSNTRGYLVKTLEKCNYLYEEFLLSPVHLGIPNQRLRYFLLAKKHPLQFVPAFHLARNHLLHDHCINSESRCHQRQSVECMTSTSNASNEGTEIKDSHIGPGDPLQRTSFVEADGVRMDSSTCSVAAANTSDGAQQSGVHGSIISKTSTGSLTSEAHAQRSGSIQRPFSTENTESASVVVESKTTSAFVLDRKIKDYLEDLEEEEMTRYLIPDKVLVRYGRLMDIVTPDDERTMCFTKGYGHKAEGTGSVLQANLDADRAEAFSLLPQDTKSELPPDVVEKLLGLKLRYFTPREIARLHHLPEEFGFPSDVTLKQCYRVLGNSLNAYVVSVLLQYLVLS